MTTHADLVEWCLAQPESESTRPFGPDVAVFKIAGKMFALVPDAANPATISLKGDPLDNERLRHKHTSVTSGYHLNKKHWNTITCDGDVGNAEIRELIEDSYDLVVDSLPKKHRLRIQGQVRTQEP
ncbi:MAG: MmcQ/YjbR family DNA-binding protein [Actinomycetia bacterium]|nr:MmcQ/YjbR family DNA-binding protein [Actinomycetes bacterium]MCP4960980.1 MmcQ/YjbR family DNA-binding protein [Actinomycetes bacterium]